MLESDRKLKFRENLIDQFFDSNGHILKDISLEQFGSFFDEMGESLSAAHIRSLIVNETLYRQKILFASILNDMGLLSNNNIYIENIDDIPKQIQYDYSTGYAKEIKLTIRYEGSEDLLYLSKVINNGIFSEQIVKKNGNLTFKNLIIAIPPYFRKNSFVSSLIINLEISEMSCKTYIFDIDFEPKIEMPEKSDDMNSIPIIFTAPGKKAEELKVLPDIRFSFFSKRYRLECENKVKRIRFDNDFVDFKQKRAIVEFRPKIYFIRALVLRLRRKIPIETNALVMLEDNVIYKLKFII